MGVTLAIIYVCALTKMEDSRGVAAMAMSLSVSNEHLPGLRTAGAWRQWP